MDIGIGIGIDIDIGIDIYIDIDIDICLDWACLFFCYTFNMGNCVNLVKS